MTPPDQFLAERRSGIGGSDVHHLFNLEPWGCTRLLWYQKRGAEPNTASKYDSRLLMRGTRLESLVADEYCEVTGRAVTEVESAIRHPDHPELMVHVDRSIQPCIPTFAQGDDRQRAESWGPGILECKTAGREVFFRIKREGMPDAYVLQLQHALYVTGADWGSFALLWPDGWQLLWWDVEPEPQLQASIRDEALKFWALVENGPAPDRLDPEDGRCHRCVYSGQCQGAAMEELMRRAGTDTVCDATLAPLVREFLDTHALQKEAEGIHTGVTEELKAALGDRTLVEVPGLAKIHFKANREWNTALLEDKLPDVATAFRTKYDLGALSKAHPELESTFKRPGTTRPLRVYSAK